MIRTVVVAALLAACALPAAAADPDPLARAAGANARVAYAGEQLIVTWDGRETRAILARVEHDPPAWTRIEYRPVGAGPRRVVIHRGSAEIQYDPATRAGTRGERLLDQDVAFADHLTWLAQNYVVTSAPGGLLGRATDVVTIRPRTPDRPAYRLDVDRETGLVLRQERSSPEGRLSEVTVFLSLRLRPRGWRRGAALPSGLTLQTDAGPAPGGEPGAARPPFSAAVPPGFHRVAEHVLQGALLQTVYSDGLSTLVVYQRPGAIPDPPGGSSLVRRPGGPVWVGRVGLRTMIHWKHRGWLVTAVGDVAPGSLLAAADRTGIDPAPRLLDRILAWLKGNGLWF